MIEITKNPKFLIVLMMLGIQGCYGIATISKKEKITNYPYFVILNERGKYTKNKINSEILYPQFNEINFNINFNFESLNKSIWKFEENSGFVVIEEKLIPKIVIDKNLRHRKKVPIESFYSRDDILILWGKPDSKYSKNGIEYWKYKNEINFSGLLIGIIVPIPIMIPVGYNYTILAFNEYNLESISYELSDITHGVFCALSICVDKDTVLIPDIRELN